MARRTQNKSQRETKMLIQKANKSDARRISYLIRKNTENVLENNYSIDQINVWKRANTPKKIVERIARSIVFCAFQNDQLIGTIGLKENQVFGVYVSYSKRGNGIGKSLLKHLEDFAISNGLSSLELTSTPSAVVFYTSNGFTPCESVIVNIDGIDFPETRMIKRL